MSNENAAKRLAWIDLSKGFAMLLVLIGHCMRDEMRTVSPALDMLYRGIYCFHMSWFFWISGYGYRLSRERGRAPLAVAGKRLKTQFPEWLLYALFIYLIFAAANAVSPLRSVLEGAGYGAMSLPRYLLASFQANNPWAYHLWFLYILILLTGIVCLADALFGGKKLSLVCWGLIAISLAALALRDAVSLGSWWRVYDYLTLYLPMFCLGALMARHDFSDRLVWIWGALGLVYIVVRTAFFSDFSGNSLRVSGMARFAVYLLADLLLPGVMLLLGRVFERIWAPKTKPGKALIGFLGKESLTVYLWHQPFCCAFLGYVLFGKLHVPALLTMAVCFAVSLGVSWLLVLLRDRGRALLAKRKTAA